MDNCQRLVIVYSPCATRADHYQRIHRQLALIAERHGWLVTEIEITDVPYHQAVKIIERQLQPGDLVVAAGGDGIAQVAFQAVCMAGHDNIFTVIPLGNGNDISRALNGRRRSPLTILQQAVANFYPLNLVVDGQLQFSLSSYITFGATTVLVDYLNQATARRWRRHLRSLSPAASLPITKFGEISRQINQLEFPDFQRGAAWLTDDSIGFFVIPAAHNILRLPKDVRLANSEFFFHHGLTKDKNLARKIIMAGAWTVKFPGEITELEELEFAGNQTDLIANVSGDNVNLGPVRRIAAIRSTKPVRVLFNKNS